MEKERNYWLHRISGGKNAYELSHLLLEKENLISIGWSGFSKENFIYDVQVNKMRAIDSKYKAEGWEISRNRWNLYRFLVSMKKGDYVVIPGWKDFSVYEIVDDYCISNELLDNKLLNKYGYNLEDDGYIYPKSSEISSENIVDIGFYHSVKPIQLHIKRAGYAKQGLTSRMKIRQTNALINDLKDELLESLSAAKAGHFICLKEELIKSSVDNILLQIRKNLDADKFEKLVEWYLESLGAKVIKTPAKNLSSTEEGDADKIAYFDKLKLVIYVQAKKHEYTTSDWAVIQIIAFDSNNNLEDDENIVGEEDFYTPLLWVISSCDNFSDRAIKMAKEKNVRLISGPQFAQLILEAGIEDLPL